MRSKERAQILGEVFTPHELVNKMLDKLSHEVWSDPNKTVIDPAGCGNGNFLVEVIKRKIECGLTPVQALNTIFGIDIMQDNVDECRERLLKQAEISACCCRCLEWEMIVSWNIICGDGLKFNWDTFEPLSINKLKLLKPTLLEGFEQTKRIENETCEKNAA